MEERFVPGLQTFVGGLRMSQPVLRGGDDDASEEESQPAREPQPLMMSRQDTTRPPATATSTGTPGRSADLQPPSDPELVPGVSPGWHVESRGRQAMELHEGVRYKDEEGWTPLDSFPARTAVGRSIARRARMRRAAARQAARKSSLASAHAETSRSTTANVMSIESITTPTPAAPQPFDAAVTTTPLEGQVSGRPLSGNSISPRSSVTIPAKQTSSQSSPAPTISFRNGLPQVNPTPPAQPQAQTDCAAPSRPTYTLQDFEPLETLGTGTFGRVILVRLKGRDAADPSSYFALKVLSKAEVVRTKQVAHINSERKILNAVEHPFLVNLIDTFQDELNCYMLMEYVVGGEIFSYLRRAGRFSTDVARFYISTIVMAIEYLHEQNIIYRDLKPENLLLDAHGYPKIADFGFAKEVTDRTWTLCGTPEYLAPEIIQSKGHGKAVDWWALGILLFEMLAGHPPFYDSQQFGVYEKILQGQIAFPPQVDPVSRDLIQSLLTADRSRRLGNLRGGAQDVKNHPWFAGVDWARLGTRSIPPPIIPIHTSAGSTSNFHKYEPADPASMPGLFPSHRRPNVVDSHAYLFPHF